ncbi:PP2C family protein-serine/threonine phosphatase [Nonomuraea aridisoli]|uniref:PPM-type phosphatase domain-containing protein n=1 Tax=Nonomuraea aridisoli TaxID=2070368 RepID=A0A2W2DXI3_9ACTN|nr:protein phosphatase 2C domain-containing protein [Nonomuraea aridisoli]PZG08969.1 hypothetical protein C1J01_38305 [Nonomuraea aridisoli]
MTEMTRCVACGGAAVAPDGRCWDCGASQPAFRAHIEFTADGGAAAVSDRGPWRGVNADAIALTRAGVWTVGVVCDGVSMSPRPERAAQVAAETGAAATAVRPEAGALPETALTEGAIRAGRAVAALAASPHTAPACTYVAGVAGPDGVWACWAGDSRAYWLPDDGVAMLLTEDDTGGHEALSSWLGADAGDLQPRVRSYRPRGPGLLLLCTDGLWRCFPSPASLRTRLTATLRVSTSEDQPRSETSAPHTTSEPHPPKSADPHTTPQPHPPESADPHATVFPAANSQEERHTPEPLNPRIPTRPRSTVHAGDRHGALLRVARALVAYAVDAGATDNVSVLLIPVSPEARAEAGW